MIRTISMLALTAALAACSSGVKLNDVPVEDKSATAVGGANANGIGMGGTAGQNNVSGVLTDKSAGNGVGPAGSNIVFLITTASPSSLKHVP